MLFHELMNPLLQVSFLTIILSSFAYSGLSINAFAQESKVETDAVNDVNFVTTFHFREGTEVVNTFKLFDTMSSGFDRSKALTFRLEGVIGEDKPLLYKAIDLSYEIGKLVQHDYSEFDVDVTFHHGDKALRQFSYGDCQIKNYNVYTEYDHEETYNSKTKFVYLDRIDFDCRGFKLGNPVYDNMVKSSNEGPKTEKNIDEKKKLEESKAYYLIKSMNPYRFK